MADALASGASVRKDVGVQVPLAHLHRRAFCRRGRNRREGHVLRGQTDHTIGAVGSGRYEQ